MARRRQRRPAPPPELRATGGRTRKSLGQHFLTDTRVLLRIAQATELTRRETVIEIGAGLGGLTEELASRAGRVIAIELDRGLADHLRSRFANTNVTVIEGDALAIRPHEALASVGAEQQYVLAGNLPYNIAQPILRHYLEAKPPPERLIVMLQAEVAESLVAKPGAMSLLSVSVQLYGEPRLLFRVPPAAFYPPPKVQSALVRIDVTAKLRADVRDVDAFFRIVRAGFSARRKQLRNALANGLRISPPAATAIIAAAEIDPRLRAQALPLDAWAALADAWLEAGQPEGAP